MAFTVNFYSFSKRENSTKRPTGNGTEFSCNIKMPSGVLNPVIELSTSTNMSSYNYCKINHFGNRYYFVSDWVSDHNLWIAHLKIDVLATYKSDILNSTQYVLRSASMANHSIPDTAYPITTDRTVSSKYVENPIKLSSGTKIDFVLGVLNFDNTANSKINGVQYLVLTESQMRDFINSMLTQDYYGIDPALSILGFNANLLHALINPAQYITESFVLPHSSMGSVNISAPKVGPWALPQVPACKAIADGYAYNVTVFEGTAFTIPSHPQTQDHGVYVNSSPYSHHVLHAGPFGDIPLDFVPSDTQATIKYRVYMDFKGNCQLMLMDNDLNVLATSYANASVPIPIIATSDKFMQGMSVIAGEVRNGIMSMGLSLADSQGRLTNALVDMVPTIDSSGLNSGVLSINQNWYLTSEFYKVGGNIVEGGGMASGKIGSPLCETVQLNTLNGFTICDKDVDIALSAYESEISQVRSLMQSGFFIED